MCNLSPGDKCRDGRDGDAGSGWLSKSNEYLHHYRKVLRSLEPGLQLQNISLMVIQIHVKEFIVAVLTPDYSESR